MKIELKNYSYLLITPARNEEAYIEKTILSVISQTMLPKKWVIVSDGSTDRTDEIIKKYLSGNSWIEFIRMPERRDRHFAAKAKAFNAGYERVKHLNYDIIGNLDADISFEENYLEYLLCKFIEMPKLGVAGTPFVEGSSRYDYRFTNIDHVSGACQLFRRECFEEVGGYIPIKGGGIDWVAVTTARMKGWKTKTFVDKTCSHHRKMGTGNSNVLMARFKIGREDYYLGGHPLWELFRAFYQMIARPYIIGGLFLVFGYAWGFLSRIERPVSQELMKFHRREQINRLKSIFYYTMKLKKGN
jgi:glycosyltransferase involved in cell wall biosynthesis